MTNLQDFTLKTLNENQPAYFSQNCIFRDIRSLAQSVVKYHGDRRKKNSSHILKQRKELSSFAKKFAFRAESHLDPSSLDLSSIESKIDLLSQADPDDVILLMSAHQPNLFPYSGVTRKIALLAALREAIEDITKESKEIVCFFGVADHDFVHNRWIRSAELPAPLRKEGIVRLSVTISQKDIMLPCNRISKPPVETIDAWKNLTASWLKENATMAQKYVKLLSPSESANSTSIESIARKNEDDFWKLVDSAYSISETLAEFNSLLLFLTTVAIFEEPILFANFSDCFTIFGEEYSWILDNAPVFSEIVKTNETKLKSYRIDSGLAEDAGEVFPLWLKCSCGSKYRLTEKSEGVQGKCQRCESEISYSIQKLKELAEKSPELFEPRSITMPVVFARSVDMSCYVGGIGGLGYLMHTREISERFQSPLPPTPFWYVDDIYASPEVLCAAYQVERLSKLYSVVLPKQSTLDVGDIEDSCSMIISKIETEMANGVFRKNPVIQRDKQMLANIRTSLDTKGCMICYAISVGLKSNFGQWVQFLKEDGRLQEPVKLRSQFFRAYT